MRIQKHGWTNDSQFRSFTDKKLLRVQKLTKGVGFLGKGFTDKKLLRVQKQPRLKIEVSFSFTDKKLLRVQ
ncbi:hypothetical protein D348_01658, partial [Enterococcus faecalis SLO2C-1]